MNPAAKLSEIIISIVKFLLDIKENFYKHIQPNYEENNFFRIRSQDKFDKVELKNVLKDEIQEESNIDFCVTHYFSEEQLDSMELHNRHFKRDSTIADHHLYNTEATVKIIMDSDWESADDALQRCRDRLEQYGNISVTKLDPDIKRSPDRF